MSESVKDMDIELPITLPDSVLDGLAMIQALSPNNYTAKGIEEIRNQRDSDKAKYESFNNSAVGEDQYQYLSKGSSGDYEVITDQTTGKKKAFSALSDDEKEANKPLSTTQYGGSFILESPLTNRWYRTDDEMRIDEKIEGFKKGGYTGDQIGGASDDIWARVKRKEIIAPEGDFRSYSQNIADRAVRGAGGGYNGTTYANQYTFQFGNVYGVDDLESSIERAIDKSNKSFGYSNSVYLSNNN